MTHALQPHKTRFRTRIFMAGPRGGAAKPHAIHSSSDELDGSESERMQHWTMDGGGILGDSHGDSVKIGMKVGCSTATDAQSCSHGSAA